MNTNLVKPFLSLCALWLLAFPVLGQAQSEIIVFPALEFSQSFQTRQVGRIDKENVKASAAFFATYDRDTFRFLGEYLLNREIPHLERFQLGWLIRPETTLWLGRFHTPLGYWNTRFHHGKYLQTTISQPAIETFEHAGGILPLHTSGLYLEGSKGMEDGDLHYALSLGMGPTLHDNAGHIDLSPLDLIPVSEDSHRLSMALRLSMRPYGDNQLEDGLFFGQSRMPGEGTVTRLDQNVFGIFLNQEWAEIHSTLSATLLHNVIEDSGVLQQSTLLASYWQLQRRLDSNWTPYMRLEHIPNTGNDPYLRYFPNFPRQRELLGLRYALSERQAIKVELTDARTRDRRLGQFALEWSAVFP